MSDKIKQSSALQSPPLPELQGGIKGALATEGVLDAWAFRRKTNAAASSLAAQRQLASATTACIDEHIKALGALGRYHEATVALQVRKDLASDFYANHESAERDRLTEAAHQRFLAEQRRKKEMLDAKREALEAQHSLEATRLFKELKFELGRIRMRARHSDAEVDGKTAEAAVVKIAGELTKLTQQQSPDLATWLDQRIVLTEVAIEEDAADGETVTEKRAELAVLRKLKVTAGGR